MDPNLDKCPYCEAQTRAKQKIRSQDIAVTSQRKGTVVGKGPPRVGDRQTRTMGNIAGSGPGGHIGEGETRRIVGGLISYTWRPEGQLFAIREGRNFIGRGKISADPYHRDCEVMIPMDDRMSETHALIICRHGMYELIDQEASNGTFLNGEMLMANQSNVLDNYAEIRTGHTIWTFIKIEPRVRLSQQPRGRRAVADLRTGDKF
jgi:hypothetical protein